MYENFSAIPVMARVKKLTIMMPWRTRWKVVNLLNILSPGSGIRWALWGFQCSGDLHRR
jgi:hypothetical protein